MIDGLVEDDLIRFTVWNADRDQEFEVKIESGFDYVNNVPVEDVRYQINGVLKLSGRITSTLPVSHSLQQNYPNPFNPATTIPYALSDRSHVSLKVYDLLGREVRTLISEIQTPGVYQAIWDGRDNRGALVSSGTYFYRIHVGNFIRSKKMILLK